MEIDRKWTKKGGNISEDNMELNFKDARGEEEDTCQTLTKRSFGTLGHS